MIPIHKVSAILLADWCTLQNFVTLNAVIFNMINANIYISVHTNYKICIDKRNKE